MVLLCGYKFIKFVQKLKKTTKKYERYNIGEKWKNVLLYDLYKNILRDLFRDTLAKYKNAIDEKLMAKYDKATGFNKNKKYIKYKTCVIMQKELFFKEQIASSSKIRSCRLSRRKPAAKRSSRRRSSSSRKSSRRRSRKQKWRKIVWKI